MINLSNATKVRCSQSHNTLAVMQWMSAIILLDDSCLHSDWYEIRHQHSACLSQFPPPYVWKNLCFKDWKVKTIMTQSVFHDSNTKPKIEIRFDLLEVDKQTSTVRVDELLFYNCFLEKWHKPLVQLEVHLLWLLCSVHKSMFSFRLHLHVCYTYKENRK